jgi:hypothetical protein
MNAIQFALNNLKYCIPRPILEKAFLSTGVAWRQTSHTNVDEQILNNVIKARVLVDCNVIGGTQVLIPLEGLTQEKPSAYTTVIHIPKTHTQGRSINSVLNLSFLSPGTLAAWGGGSTGGSVGAYAAQENSAVMNSLQGIMAAHDTIPMTSSARVQLIAENTILIKDSMNLPPNSFLRCVVANDENLNNLQLRSYRKFSQLVEYAVKSYIYNELIISLDQGELQGGQVLGVIKDAVQAYSEAEQNYQDYLTDFFEAILMMSDQESYHRLIKLTIGGHR